MSTEVLLIDDSEGDVRLTREALRDSGLAINLSVATDGVDGLAYLRREGIHVDAPRPALILLDLNMPRMDGRELLAFIKADSALRSIPVVILTTSDAKADVDIGYELQASCYLRKPGEWEGFADLMKNTLDFWLTKVKLPQLTLRA
jgi:chemotaxis family two-component system response regulator Rcp1